MSVEACTVCDIGQAGSRHDGLEGRGALCGGSKRVEVRFVEKQNSLRN